MTLIVTAPGLLHTERHDEEAKGRHGAGRAGYAMTILRCLVAARRASANIAGRVTGSGRTIVVGRDRRPAFWI